MKRSIASAALILASSCFIFGQPKAAQPAGPLQEVADLLLGRWLAEVTWAVDYPGLGKKGEKVSGFEISRWSVDGMAIESESFLGKTTGKALLVWDAAGKQIRYFGVDSGGGYAIGTISREGSKLVWSSAGSLADGQKVEYKGETTFTDNGHTRIDTGATILNGARNEFRDVYRRVVQ